MDILLVLLALWIGIPFVLFCVCFAVAVATSVIQNMYKHYLITVIICMFLMYLLMKG